MTFYILQCDNYTLNLSHIQQYTIPGLILGLLPANERRCYFVTTFLIGWMQA